MPNTVGCRPLRPLARPADGGYDGGNHPGGRVSFQTILFACTDGVATITLNRPERLNALTNTMFRELGEALDRVAADPGLRAVLLTGAGRGFCAGADLAGDGIDADKARSWGLVEEVVPESDLENRVIRIAEAKK